MMKPLPAIQGLVEKETCDWVSIYEEIWIAIGSRRYWMVLW